MSSAPAPGGPPPPPSAPPLAPPPPPPPPPPGPGMQRSVSAIDLIRERRSKKSDQHTVLESGPKQPEVPNMLDVLKDMGKVKLRSVKKCVWLSCSTFCFLFLNDKSSMLNLL